MEFRKLFVLKFLLLLQRSSSNNCNSPGGNIPCELRCQFYDTGEFYNNADKCEDDIPDCQILFNCPAEASPCNDPWDWYDGGSFTEGNPTTYPKVRSTACDLPGLQHIARKCAKTCNLCCEKPEFMCYNDPDWTDWCVEHQYEYCHSEEWRPVMAELCGQTCGLCLERVCADKIYDCESASELCTHIDHIEFMRENCAGACGYCPVKPETETCVDTASNCQQLSHLCKDRIYMELMDPYCQKTCNNCPTTNSTECYDSTPLCVHWAKNGFCQSEFYNTAQKRTYCGRTCQLC